VIYKRFTIGSDDSFKRAVSQMNNSAEDVTARHNDCASFLHIFI